MNRSVIGLVVAGALAAAAPVARGQGKQREEPPPVPRSQLPPAGMCRVWLNDVPASQQPAPTDCASAVRNRPANARVIFSGEQPDDARNRPRVPVRELAPRGKRRSADEKKKPDKPDSGS